MRRRHNRAVLVVLALSAAVVLGPAAGLGATAKTSSVKVRDDYYSRSKVPVKSGGSVKWTWAKSNRDTHNVALTNGPKGVKKGRFRSAAGSVGITFKRKFKAPGTYDFRCTFHPTMRMKVVVSK